MKQKYETIIIINPKLTEEEVDNTISKIEKFMNENGRAKNVEKWGKKKLVYPIQKHTEGYYVLINFTSDPEVIDELQRIYNITEEIIKHIIIKKD